MTNIFEDSNIGGHGFEDCFRTNYARLCIYADSILHDKHLSEDVVQSVFCNIWNKRTSLNIKEKLSSYLYKSVYHASLNVIRNDKICYGFVDYLEKNEILTTDEIDQFYDADYQQKLKLKIDKVVESLPVQCREIFLLSRFSGKHNSEIALLMNISIRTVETQLYRAMQKLKAQLSLSKDNTLLLYFLKC